MARQEDGRAPALGRIKRATTAAIDCSACPRSLAKAGKTAEEELQNWDRFQLVDPKQAELIFMFSANPYLGDYLTRKGPDTRPVKIDGAVMTVIDARTGEELWSDSRRWGSYRVSAATRALIEELRSQMEVEAKRWTLEDVLRCSGAPAYQGYAFLTPEAAVTKPGSRASREDVGDRLRASSPDAPDFCKRAQLVVGANGQIQGYEVLATESDSLDVADVLERADRFEFTSGKDPRTQRVYFTAQSRDKKILIQFDQQGRRTILTRVYYAY